MTAAARWIHGRRGAKYCKTCRDKWKQKRKASPCADCKNKMPPLEEETGNILECFLMCQTQLRATSGGAYALDWGIIQSVAESLSIPTDGQFYRLLAAYEEVLIEEMNSKL